MQVANAVNNSIRILFNPRVEDFKLFDFLMVKRGNPNLSNTKVHDYFLTYNTQLDPVNLQFNFFYTILTDNLTNDYE